MTSIGIILLAVGLALVFFVLPLIFMIIGEVKVFKNYKERGQRNILESVFNSFIFISLLICVGGAIFYNIFLLIMISININQPSMNPYLQYALNIYSMEEGIYISSLIFALIAEILLLVSLILIKVALVQKNNKILYASFVISCSKLIVNVCSTLFSLSILFSFGYLVLGDLLTLILSILYVPFEIVLLVYLFKMMPNIKNYFDSNINLNIDKKFLSILIVDLSLLFILPTLYQFCVLYLGYVNGCFVPNSIQVIPLIIFILLFVQLYVCKNNQYIETKNEKADEIVIEEKEISKHKEIINGVPLTNKEWIERKNSEGNNIDFNNNVIEKMKHTKRSLVKIILLSIVTFGIYGLYHINGIVKDLNTVRSNRGIRKKLMNAIGILFLSLFTIGILPLIWGHKLTKNMSEELKYRGINYKFNLVHYWVFCILLADTIVCPIIYLHKLVKSSNLVNKHHNLYGDIKGIKENEKDILNLGTSSNINENSFVNESENKGTNVNEINNVSLNNENNYKEQSVPKEDCQSKKDEQKDDVLSPKERLLQAKELYDLGLITLEDYNKVKEDIIKLL